MNNKGKKRDIKQEKQNEFIEIEGNKIRRTVFFKSIEEYLSTIGLPNWTNDVTPLNEVNMRKINKEIENNTSIIGNGNFTTVSKNLIGAINELNNKIDNGIEYISDIQLINNRIYLIDNKGNKLGNGFDATIFNGRDGKGLEYTWNGTELGIKKEGESSYSFVDLKGQKGEVGNIGETGLSAYESACATGFKGSEAEWVLSLKGSDGKNLEFVWDDTRLGIKKQGDSSFIYTELKGNTGETGQRGLSAYEIAVNELGFEGDELQWIASLKGQKGEKGDGIKILGSYSSYSYLPSSGQLGDAYLVNMDLYIYDRNATPKPWTNAGQIKGEKGDTGLTGRQGQKGDAGKSAYQSWIELGNSGSTEDFINNLRGSDGKDLEFIWNGTQLGVRKQGEIEYSYVQLKGETGDKGEKGERGNTGQSIEFNWNGTQLGVKQEGQEDYVYTDVKGKKGDIGKSIEFNWNGTELGIKQEGAIDYIYTNLKGDKGDRGDGINILGSLSSEDDLPNTGKVGDAYLINNDLYVYDPNNTPKPFINVGNIKGEKGDQGEKGERGLNAYEVWLSQGNTGSVQDYLLYLKGEQGIQGETGLTGEKGDAGKSAYEIWITEGNEGTIEDYLLSLKGERGEQGLQGDNGKDIFIGTQNETPENGELIWIVEDDETEEIEDIDSIKDEIKEARVDLASNSHISINERLNTDFSSVVQKIEDSKVELNQSITNINSDIEGVNESISTTQNEISNLKTLIGNTALQTTNKTITGAVNELFQNASNGKTLISNAIAGKGVNASSSDSFATLKNKIKNIVLGYGVGDKLASNQVENMQDKAIWNYPLSSWSPGVATDNNGSIIINNGGNAVRVYNCGRSNTNSYLGAFFDSINVSETSYVIGTRNNNVMKFQSNYSSNKLWTYTDGFQYIVFYTCVDSNGNVFFRASDGTTYIYKIDKNGSYIKRITIGTGDDVKVDKSNNVFVFLTYNMEKYDNNLSKIWTCSTGGTSTSYTVRAGGCVDDSGNIYFKCGTGIAKITASGSLAWKKTLSGYEYSKGIACSGNGDIYAVREGTSYLDVYDTSGNLVKTITLPEKSAPYIATFDKSTNTYAYSNGSSGTSGAWAIGGSGCYRIK